MQIDDLLKLWARRGSEPVFEQRALSASLQQLGSAKAQRAEALAQRSIGQFMPCSHGRVAPLQVRDWYGTFGQRRAVPTDHPHQVRIRHQFGLHTKQEVASQAVHVLLKWALHRRVSQVCLAGSPYMAGKLMHMLAGAFVFAACTPVMSTWTVDPECRSLADASAASRG